MQFTIRERGAGRKEFFRRLKEKKMNAWNDTPDVVAKDLVMRYYNGRHPTNKITTDDVVVVWQCYILGFWKVLVTTNIQDGMYYEVTFDRTGYQETGTCHVYLDAYKRWENVSLEFDAIDEGQFDGVV
jgi:hypothetical protein